MIIGLRGNPLPESETDFKAMSTRLRIHSSCIECGEPFSSDNTHSAAGWRDTQIVGMCEDCYDGLFAEGDD